MSAPGTNKVDYSVVNNIAIVTLDHFPVNTLTNAVQLGLEDASDEISKNPQIKGVIVRGAGLRALCAGADIQDLNKKHERYPTKNFVECFEALKVPVVAILQGFTLGGGFEMSLGCHYRVITPGGFVGLPEVNIGLLPGGQGTQRLPRLVGVESALKVMLTGEHVPAAMALKMGVVDAVMSVETIKSSDAQLNEAIKFLESKMGEDLSKRRISNIPAPKLDAATEKILGTFSKNMKAKRKNEIAPQMIIDCVKAAAKEQDFKKGCEAEQELFYQVLMSKEAKGLQHIFFAERAAGKVANNKEKPAKIKKVGVLGAGTMGGGIAMCFANIGIEVLLLDREQKFVDHGMKVIAGNYERSVKRGSRSQKQMDKAMSLIKTTIKYEDMKDVDMVIEAVFEDLDLKKEIFAKLDKVCKKDCILASNTSYLNIDAMAEKTNRPEKVVGMHFFSPANVMKLLENIRGRWTDDKTVTTVMDIGTKIGKWPVLVNNRWGFVGNRMLRYYSQEANRMVLMGVDFKRVDKVAVEFGMPMGPFRMSDLVGLDIGYQARKKKGLVDEKKSITDALIGAGRLGMKNGKGWYDYSGRDAKASPEADQLIKQVVANNKLKILNLTDDEIKERLFFPVINEGCRILEERVAQKPDDVDVVFVHGYNWPRVTGGPMFYGELIGYPKVLEVLEKGYKDVKDNAFKPSQLLIDCAKSGKSLAQFWKENESKYTFDKMNANL